MPAQYWTMGREEEVGTGLRCHVKNLDLGVSVKTDTSEPYYESKGLVVCCGKFFVKYCSEKWSLLFKNLE